MLACNPGTLCTPTEGKGLSTSLQPLLLCPAPSPRNHRWDSPHYTTTNYSSPSVRDFHWGSFILGTSIPEDPGHHFPHWDALGAGMGKLCELGRVCEVLSSQFWDWGFSSSGKDLLCRLKLGFLIPPFLGTGCQLPRATMPLLL